MRASRFPRILVTVLFLAAVLSAVFGAGVGAEKPVVRLLLFHSKDCTDCQSILSDFMPTITEKYGEQVEVKELEISDPAVYEQLIALEAAYGIPTEQAKIPEIFLGNIALLGAADIRAKLDESIAGLLDAGGADFPALPTAEPTATTIPTVTPHPQGSVPGAVHVMLFFSPTCPHCHVVRSEIMPPLYEKYGDKLVVREFDVSQPYNFSLEMSIEQAAGVPAEKQGYVPLMIVGKYLLTNANAIQQGLDEIIQEYLDQGGSEWPIDPQFFEDSAGTGTANLSTAESTEGTPAPTTVLDKPLRVEIAYFAKAGCQECSRAETEVNYLKTKYPFVNVTVFDINENAPLNEWLSARYDVPEKYRLTAPAIFVGEDFLVGEDVSTQKIEGLIQKYAPSGADATWANWESEAPQAQSRIIERFKSFGVLTVLLAGLIDGLNPCAFATLVFFVSYLAFTGRKGREILLVGGAFALGVFLTYLLVGVGFYELIQRLSFLGSLRVWVYGITAALCIVLAVMSFLDFLAARQGRHEEMRLRLPMALRRRINTLIRENAKAEAIAVVAFVTGFLISIIELACTGQVYLPTIIFVMGDPNLRSRAFLYLVLYNIFFILPLITVFVLAYLGTSSEKMSMAVNKNTAWIKLATAILFLVLGGVLISMMF